jgi:GTPase SAR1 family protein
MDLYGFESEHREQRQEAEALRVFTAFKNLFQGVDSETVLTELARLASFQATSFAADNPHMTSFNEGKRDLFLTLLRYVNQPIDALLGKETQ